MQKPGSKKQGNETQILNNCSTPTFPLGGGGGRLQSDTSNATVEEQIVLGLQSSSATHTAKSCLIRGPSSKSNASKKHVNYNESTQLIPPHHLSDQNSLVDDDDVFSDSIAPQLPRGDMCAPYLTKRGSMPGLVALPDWFAMEHYREDGGIQEPPVTPVGRDELALKRHRLFSEILQAAQAAAEHRVRFNPWGPTNVLQQQDPLIGNEWPLGLKIRFWRCICFGSVFVFWHHFNIIWGARGVIFKDSPIEMGDTVSMLWLLNGWKRRW